MAKKLLLPVFIMCAFSMISYGQASTKDYLHVPGPIVIQGKSYNLVWTSHPAENYFKQEYIIKGDVVTKFKSMVLVEVVLGDVQIQDIVATKVAELKKLKESNPIINYETFDNSKAGEYMIDFLISDDAPGGIPGILERNVYRYKEFVDKSGQKGILLFGVSIRSYGDDIKSFLTSLKSTRNNLITEVAKFTLPKINIAKQ